VRSSGGDTLGRRQQQMRTEGLSRFLVYVLGHRPDEFGLVPDRDGFVPFKELLQALHEEVEWRYVRRSHINEILLGNDRGLFESKEGRIRSIEHRWELNFHHPVAFPAKILFTAIRRRAHAVAMEKGLRGGIDRPILLATDRDMALRVGRRRDQEDPVVLEIMAGAAAEKRIGFYSFGDLFLGTEIPARFIAGPPVPKETTEGIKETDKVTQRPAPKAAPPPAPGTFILDPSRDPDRYRKAKGKKPKGWKEAARKTRRKSNP
jgi:putative RNA 2'-phosphotransferase